MPKNLFYIQKQTEVFLYILLDYWQTVKENNSISSYNFFDKRQFLELASRYLD